MPRSELFRSGHFRQALKFIAAIVVGLISLILLMVYRNSVISKPLTEPQAVARRFIEVVMEGRSTDAYALITRSYAHTLTKEDFAHGISVVTSRAGAVQSVVPKEAWWADGSDGRHACFIFYVQGSKSVLEMYMAMSPEDGGWRIREWKVALRASMEGPASLDWRKRPVGSQSAQSPLSTSPTK